MRLETCHGCIRARLEDGVSVPGSPACLGCRRACSNASHLPDLWLRRPPGGSPVAVDDRGICFRMPWPAGVPRLIAASALLLFLLGIAGSVSALALGFLLAGAWAGLKRGGGIRHYWGVVGGRVWHIAGVGRLAITQAYPAHAVRAFHCAGPRRGGPVAFHHGRYTIRVAALPAGVDNEWLMLRLNERLARARRS